MQWPTQKEQDIDRQITTQKTKDEATRNSQKNKGTQVLRKGKQFLLS